MTVELPKGETFLQGYSFMKESVIHPTRHKRKQLISFASTRCKRLSNFRLQGKIVQILWAYRVKMDAAMIQKNFG